MQQGSVAHAEKGGGVSQAWDEGGSEVDAGVRWKVWGLAQGCRQIHEREGGGGFRGDWAESQKRVSANFMTSTFVFSFFFICFSCFCDFFCCILF